MFKKIKKFIVMGIAGLSLVMPGLAVPAITGIASAEGTPGYVQSFCKGANAAANTEAGGPGSCDETNSEGGSGVQKLATKVTNIFSIIVGAASIIMIIYGGFRYITSGGDSGKVGNAKNTLIYAIIGLVIVALAQLIVRFVLTQANNASGDF